VVEDIVVRSTEEFLEATAATEVDDGAFEGLGPVDTVALQNGDTVLVVAQDDSAENGLYVVRQVDDGNGNITHPWQDQQKLPKGTLVKVKKGAKQKGVWEQKAPLQSGKQRFKKLNKSAKHAARHGKNKQLGDQLAEDAQFARIYGFSYEGTYYELPDPTLFLVQGEGESATDSLPPEQAARAPFGPSRSGVASADYQMADDILVWAYDKADYTIRMDAMTGMLEQVLLDIYFGFDSPAISGAKVSGAKVSGAKVSGAKVSGAKVSGAKVSGAKARGPGD
jgi:hypothetical protein